MKVLQAHDKDNYLSNTFIHINGVGYFSEIDYETHTDRPNGWRDYQLILITNGVMNVIRNGKTYCYKKGSLILFKPDEPQLYTCPKDKNSAYIWIHFTGYAVKDVLQELSLYALNHYTVKNDAKDVYRVEKIVKELSLKKPNYRIRSVQFFLDFLSSISLRLNAENKNLTEYDKITPAIDKIISNTEEYFNVNDLANLCNLSVSRFLFLFKKNMGKSPIAFKNEILIERTKNMLTDSDMSITEISLTLGEQDPLYLSKKFKKAYGLSPQNYRERYKNTNNTKNDKV